MSQEDRSIFDSLAKLYQFLNEKYSEEISKSSKNKKKKSNINNIKSTDQQQQKSSDAQVTAKIIHDFNERKTKSAEIEIKEYNLKTKKLQTKKKKKNSNPPIDYDPIPFNFLSTKYKNEKTQVDEDNEQIYLKEEHNYSKKLCENYELVYYLTNSRIKSDIFAIWTKKFYYSVMQKKSNKSNGTSSNKNDQNQKNCTNSEQPCFLFTSSESIGLSDQETKKITFQNLQAKVDKNNKKKCRSNEDIGSSKDDRELCVDIVLSEYQ